MSVCQISLTTINNEELQTIGKYRTLFKPLPYALEVSQDHEKEIPMVTKISKIPLLLKKVGSLFGHCVVSVHTSKVNEISSTYLKNNTLCNTIMLLHHMTYTPWCGQVIGWLTTWKNRLHPTRKHDKKCNV